MSERTRKLMRHNQRRAVGIAATAILATGGIAAAESGNSDSKAPNKSIIATVNYGPKIEDSWQAAEAIDKADNNKVDIQALSDKITAAYDKKYSATKYQMPGDTVSITLPYDAALAKTAEQQAELSVEDRDLLPVQITVFDPSTNHQE